MEKKMKHLEFIQAVISRMASNFFMLKGWSIALTVAVLGLSANSSSLKFASVVYFILLAFWILDGYFLSQEKQFRALYDEVRLKNEDQIDFSMDISKFNKEKNTWMSAMESKIVLIFYIPLFIVMATISIFIQ